MDIATVDTVLSIGANWPSFDNDCRNRMNSHRLLASSLTHNLDLNLNPHSGSRRGISWTTRLRLRLGLRARAGVCVLTLLAAIFLNGCRKTAADADQVTRLSNLGNIQPEAGDGARAAHFFRQPLARHTTLT